MNGTPISDETAQRLLEAINKPYRVTMDEQWAEDTIAILDGMLWVANLFFETAAEWGPEPKEGWAQRINTVADAVDEAHVAVRELRNALLGFCYDQVNFYAQLEASSTAPESDGVQLPLPTM